MKLRLPNEWTQEFTKVPEWGMGYHLIELTLSDGRVFDKVVVLNGEYACVPSDVGADLNAKGTVGYQPDDLAMWKIDHMKILCKG